VRVLPDIQKHLLDLEEFFMLIYSIENREKSEGETQ